MKATVFALLMFPCAAVAQVNAVITDADEGAYNEGVLTGYTVRAGGQTICNDPIAKGRYIACSGKATKRVWLNSKGTLGV